MRPSERPRDSAEAEETCLVAGCGGAAVRRLSLAEARKGFPDLPEKGRRAPLCREHYRAWKKATKDERKLDRLGW
jgi:hypothetical protein